VSGKIRGEYWIVDGRSDFADGDTGDQNHEMIALNSIASDHTDALYYYATEMGLETEGLLFDDEPFATASDLLIAIRSELIERGIDPDQADDTITKRLEVAPDVYKMLGGGGDARLHVMKDKGWVAVRSNNVELFGYDQNKRRELASGLEDILDQEGIEEPDETLEFNLYDHKTGRSSYVTLADIKGASQMRPQSMPNTTYNKPLFVPPDRSKMSPKPMDAKSRSLLQTSEGTCGFRGWMEQHCGSFMVRRTWPELIASEMEAPSRRSSSRGRRSRRR